MAISTVSFFSIPIYVSDNHTRYFLFDIHFPEKYCEESLVTVTRFLVRLRQDFISDKKNIDRVIASFFDSLPFFGFNYFFFHPQQQLSRYSDEGIDKLLIGEKSLQLSGVENDELSVGLVLALAKGYLK